VPEEDLFVAECEELDLLGVRGARQEDDEFE